VLELTEIEEWRAFASAQREKGLDVGLVPTMGALHDGHRALFAAARAECDVVVATIFVNPRQFHDDADLARYPRTPDADRVLALEAGVDCLVSPTLESMWPDYPAPTPTTVSLGALGEVFEGVGRPGHFDGVASVVAKLFAITGPCRAFFGEKDFQQVAMVRELVRDLGFDVVIVGCPIVRDDDGLALSSRNGQLSFEGRGKALGLSRAIAAGAYVVAPASELRARMRAVLDAHRVEVAYVDVVDPTTLVPSLDGEAGLRRALVAGFADGVRLIDNGPVVVGG
jgi:pantoate--beta-alanine ligase